MQQLAEIRRRRAEAAAAAAAAGEEDSCDGEDNASQFTEDQMTEGTAESESTSGAKSTGKSGHRRRKSVLHATTALQRARKREKVVYATVFDTYERRQQLLGLNKPKKKFKIAKPARVRECGCARALLSVKFREACTCLRWVLELTALYILQHRTNTLCCFASLFI